MFANEFYSDLDCQFVQFSKGDVKCERFVRDNWNKGNPHRTPFQKNLDHLVFSEAFRRLQGKTQVRRIGPKCYSRTRLSHSMEIARIARSLVKRLYSLEARSPESFVDLDLVEFACYAHDIGNPPFGHAGERALNACMKDHGGFEGNAQSLRIITEIAWSDSDRPMRKGISPTKAAVEAILKYRELQCDQKDRPLDQRSKFLYNYQDKLIKALDIPNSQAIECQIMDKADDIGNAIIDFTDGVRAGIITDETLNDWKRKLKRKLTQHDEKNLPRNLTSGNISWFANKKIGDCVRSFHSKNDKPITRWGCEVKLTEEWQEFINTLREINSELVFKGPDVQANDNSGVFVIRVIFEAFVKHYCCKVPSDLLHAAEIMPTDWDHRLKESDPPEHYRLVSDYISGMTDDYAKMIFDRLIEKGLTA